MKRLLLSVFFLSVTGAAVSQEWVEQNTNLPGASRGVNKLYAVDASTVWGLGYYGSAADPDTVLQEYTKTSDGGTNWSAGTIEIFEPTLAINNIVAVDGTTAMISAIDGDVGGGGVYKTIDGGANWTNVIPDGYLLPTSFVNVVHMFDANIAIAQGDPIGTGVGEFEVYRTTDGGTTWTLTPGSVLPNPLNGEYGYNGGNIAAGSRFWFVTNKGRIYRTGDKGLTWEVFQTPLTDFGSATASGSLYMSDDNNGLILKLIGTSTYSIHRTTDGGATWGPAEPWTGGYNTVLSYVPGTTTIVGTSAQTTAPAVPGSAYSNDNGVTWTTIDTGVQRGDVVMVNGSTGWTAGFTDPDDPSIGGIYKFSGTLAVNNPIANSKFTVSPNPTSGLMQISNENTSISQVAAFDILGKQVYSATFSDLNNVSVDLSGLNSGTYFVRVTDLAGANQVVKVLKN